MRFWGRFIFSFHLCSEGLISSACRDTEHPDSEIEQDKMGSIIAACLSLISPL